MTRRNSRLTLLLRYTNGDDIFREPYKFTCTPTLTHVLYYARRRLVDGQLLHKNLRLAELPRAYVVHENPRASVAGPAAPREVASRMVFCENLVFADTRANVVVGVP